MAAAAAKQQQIAVNVDAARMRCARWVLMPRMRLRAMGRIAGQRKESTETTATATAGSSSIQKSRAKVPRGPSSKGARWRPRQSCAASSRSSRATTLAVVLRPPCKWNAIASARRMRDAQDGTQSGGESSG
eukprot:345133-Pleurochrysis_carterae.AAC.2